MLFVDFNEVPSFKISPYLKSGLLEVPEPIEEPFEIYLLLLDAMNCSWFISH